MTRGIENDGLHGCLAFASESKALVKSEVIEKRGGIFNAIALLLAHPVQGEVLAFFHFDSR